MNFRFGFFIYILFLFSCSSKYDNSNLDGRNLSVVFDNQKIIDKPLYIESSDSDEFQSGFVVGIRTLEYKYVRSKQLCLQRS